MPGGINLKRIHGWNFGLVDLYAIEVRPADLSSNGRSKIRFSRGPPRLRCTTMR